MTYKGKQPRKKYSREFKIEAVKLHLEQRMTQQQVAKDLGVHPQVYWSWVEKYRKDNQEAFPGKGRLKPSEQKVRDLEEQVRRLTMERDILKKAMAYFAKLPE